MAVVLSVSSQVVRGHVGNSAAAFALMRLGHEVWPLASVMMAHHPGHDRTAPPHTTPAPVIAQFVASLERQGWLGAVDAMLIGYVADAEQAAAIAEAAGRVRLARPDALIALDPIIGDDGRIYVAQDVARAVRDTLLPLADLATPNLFELGWLSGGDVSRLDAAIAAARALGPGEVLVTSAPGAPGGHVRNLVVTGEGAFAADGAHVESAVHGAGDLMAALHVGWRLGGAGVGAALGRATGALAAVIAQTRRLGRDELALGAAQERIADPACTVEAVPVDMPAGPGG